MVGILDGYLFGVSILKDLYIAGLWPAVAW